MTSDRIRTVLTQVEHPSFAYRLVREGDNLFLRIECPGGRDNRTGLPSPWVGRKWRLSEHMTDGEVVQTAFLATLQAIEHETREQFTFLGQPIFDPHYDIYALVELRAAAGAIQERAA